MVRVRYYTPRGQGVGESMIDDQPIGLTFTTFNIMLDCIPGPAGSVILKGDRNGSEK